MVLRKPKVQMEEITTTTKSKSKGQIYFERELGELTKLSPAPITFEDKDNIMKFKVTVTPAKDSYWFGGKYEFEIEIPEDYNTAAPKVHCLTKIYHPNIDLSGNVCLNILKEDWKPVLEVVDVVNGLIFLFLEPNPNDPLNHEAATVMRDNLDQFVANVKKSLKGNSVGGETYPKFL
jgi:ubiquitin-conjugating enzyme E2 M